MQAPAAMSSGVSDGGATEFSGVTDGEQTNVVIVRLVGLRDMPFKFNNEEKKDALKKAVELLSAAKKLPRSIGVRLTYRLGLLAFFLFQFLYPIVLFFIEREYVAFNLICMFISLLGLITQLFGLRKLCIDIIKCFHCCGACKRDEGNAENCCNHKITCTSGPCGSIFNEFITSFFGEFLIYPSMICNLIGFINGRSWELNNTLDFIDTGLMGISVLWDLIYAKWQYVIQTARAMRATYRKYDDARGYHLSCKEWCNNRLCTPPSYLPIFCFVLSVMHLAMLGSISFRIYADNFYGEPVVTTAPINGTLENITIYVAPEEGSYRLVGFTIYMVITGGIIPLYSIAAYVYINQYWFQQLLYVIRSKEKGGAVNRQRAQCIEQIPSREKWLSLLFNPLSYVVGLPLTAMMLAFTFGAFGHDYDNLEEALPAKLVNVKTIFAFAGYAAFSIANYQTVILAVMIWYFPCTCYLYFIYHTGSV